MKFRVSKIKIYAGHILEKCRNKMNRGVQLMYKEIIRRLPLKKGTVTKRRNEPVIVSLTSYPPRFEYLTLCIKSLLYQTYKPDKIILYLGSDTQAEAIPDAIKQLRKYGVKIEMREGNMKPHKKYYYAMQEYPDASIITVDDDVVYSPFLVRSLVKKHRKYPGAICARRVREIGFTGGKLLPYRFWNVDVRAEQPSIMLLGTGVGGILYPPGALYEDAFDKDKIYRLCLNADDIWLKFMEVLNDTPVVWCKCIWTHPVPINQKDETGLCINNLEGNQNDAYIEDMLETYPQFMEHLKGWKADV